MKFDDISNALLAADLPVSPAEIHGLLCGCICGGRTLQLHDLNELVCKLLDGVAEEVEPIEALLGELYQHSVGQVRNGGFVFQPVLPDDDAALDERVMALGEWCQGFLFGLGQSGLSNETQLTTEIADVLRDLAAVAQVGLNETAEDDEVSYTELVEYVRVAVLLVAAELDDSAHSDQQTLH